ncbi:MAG TPA: VF530 family protein [Opitutaceae bacterium]|jgi:uncharacterized protein (DUF2132 family)
MPNRPARNPLHGVTLEAIVNFLVERCGWEEMGREVNIRCFTSEPSLGSSLHFLRRTPWARTKVEQLYLRVKAKEMPADSASAASASPAAASRFMGAGGQDRSAVRAHALNRSHAHIRSDNQAKV